MTKKDISFSISILLFFSLSFTGTTGLIAHKLDLHHFSFHKYGAYCTLFLALIHVSLNFKQIITYLKGRFLGHSKS
jgi:hypothetical protein